MSRVELRAGGTEAAHGFLMAKAIQDLTVARHPTAHGPLYRAMHELDRTELLESFWEHPRLALGQGRPPQRFYRVTTAGDRALAQARAEGKVGLSSLTPRRSAT